MLCVLSTINRTRGDRRIVQQLFGVKGNPLEMALEGLTHNWVEGLHWAISGHGEVGKHVDDRVFELLLYVG